LTDLLEQRNAVFPGGSIDTETEKFNVVISGQFDAVRQIQGVTVGRVAVGAGGQKMRQPLALATQQMAGANESLGPLPAPLTQNVPVRLKDLDLKVIRGYEDPRQSIVRFSDTQQSSD
jgi:multidrug efflux pump subunit AcrB